MIDNLDNFSDIHTKDNISSLGLQYPTHHASHLRSKYDQHHTRNIDPVNLPIVHSGSTIDNFREVLKNIDLDTCEENGENAFYICDLAQVYRQYLQWQDILGGRVEAFLGKLSPTSPLAIYTSHSHSNLMGVDLLSGQVQPGPTRASPVSQTRARI